MPYTNHLKLWANGPYGPGCGEPFYICKACQIAIYDPPYTLDQCPHCAFKPNLNESVLAQNIRKQQKSYQARITRERAIKALEDLVPLALQVLTENNVSEFDWSPLTPSAQRPPLSAFRIYVRGPNVLLIRNSAENTKHIRFHQTELELGRWVGEGEGGTANATLELLQDFQNELARLLSAPSLQG